MNESTLTNEKAKALTQEDQQRLLQLQEYLEASSKTINNIVCGIAFTDNRNTALELISKSFGIMQANWFNP